MRDSLKCAPAPASRPRAPLAASAFLLRLSVVTYVARPTHCAVRRVRPSVLPTHTVRLLQALLASAVLLALSANDATAQPENRLLGKWSIVRITDAEGAPDPDSGGLIGFTFGADGFMDVERTVEAVAEDPHMPDHYEYRVDADAIYVIVDEEVQFATFWFESGQLVIRDEEQGLVAYLERSR